jgi:hypothetical protein
MTFFGEWLDWWWFAAVGDDLEEEDEFDGEDTI